MASAGVPAAYQFTGRGGRCRDARGGRFRLAAAAGRPGPGRVLLLRAGRPDRRGNRRAHGQNPARRGRRKAGGGRRRARRARWRARAPGNTVTIADSRTYAAVAEVTCAPADGDADSSAAGATAVGPSSGRPLTVRARPGERPLIRFPEQHRPGERPQWVFHGGQGARLVLDGLFVSGGDIVLRGPFEHVKIVGCTFDPGTLDDGPPSRRGARPPATAPVSRRHPRAGPDGPRVGRRPPAAAHPAVDRARATAARQPAGPAAKAAGRRPVPGDRPQHPRPGPHPQRRAGRARRGHRQHPAGHPHLGRGACTAADVFDPVLLYDQLSPGPGHRGPAPRSAPTPCPRSSGGQSADGIPPVGAQAAARPPGAARERAAGPGQGAERGQRPRAVYRPDRWAGVPLSPQTRDLLGQRQRAPRAG